MLIFALLVLEVTWQLMHVFPRGLFSLVQHPSAWVTSDEVVKCWYSESLVSTGNCLALYPAQWPQERILLFSYCRVTSDTWISKLSRTRAGRALLLPLLALTPFQRALSVPKLSQDGARRRGFIVMLNGYQSFASRS